MDDKRDVRRMEGEGRGILVMKKARDFGQKAQKKGLTAQSRYGRIFPH